MPKLQYPPQPLWRGVMVGIPDLFTSILRDNLNSESHYQRRHLTGRIQERQDLIREYSESVKSAQQRLAAARASLRELESTPDAVNASEEVLRQELEFIKSLPGMLGIRQAEGGEITIHVRTSTLYRGKRYDMGDFEVTFGSPNRLERHRETMLTVRGTRIPVISQACPEPGCDCGRREHLYFHGRVLANDTAPEGWFCFGGRLDQIRDHLRRGEFGEAVHLMVATMNSVNTDHLERIPRYYPEIPLEAEEELPQEPTQRWWQSRRLADV